MTRLALPRPVLLLAIVVGAGALLFGTALIVTDPSPPPAVTDQPEATAQYTEPALSQAAALNAQDAVILPLGVDLQSVVDQHPPGTTFVIAAGVHRMQSITPRDGDIFIGEPGAVLNGARLLTEFTPIAGYWVISGQEQEILPGGRCQAEFSRCSRAEQLFVDGLPLRHVDSLDQLAPGTWHFDYDGDRIYMADDPAGRMVETSVTQNAFYGGARDITIRDLVIEKYASRAQHGAIEPDGGANWSIDTVQVRLNHGAGIRLSDGMRVINSAILSNGQIGLSGVGDNVLIEDTEIAYNNTAGFESTWEAGGAKFIRTEGLIARNNYVHHNDGPGLWTDIDNINTLYENNVVIYNQRIGIYHEISHDAVIRGNQVKFNGLNYDNWLWGSQILIATSSHVEVYNNVVVVSADIGNGIGIVNQDRGAGERGVWRSDNNHVHQNVIVYTGAHGTSGAATDFNHDVFWAQSNNRFSANTYYVMDAAFAHWRWNDRELTWEAMQAEGQEVNGRLIAGQMPPDALTIPGWRAGE